MIAGKSQAAYIMPMSSIRPWRDIARRPSRQIMVGKVPVGGNAPISVQTMTNTLTSDAAATIDQIRRCEDSVLGNILVPFPDVARTVAAQPIGPARTLSIDVHPTV